MPAMVRERGRSEFTDTLLQQCESSTVTQGDGLLQLAQHVTKCQRCDDLVHCRQQTVFGVGNPSADVMFVGEAPGADEDRQGIPFVGKAGQLLDRIIIAAKLKREEIYICNVLRCRPPGNRNPAPQEIENCREYLEATIQLVRPRFIVCWGTVAAQTVLKEKRSVGKLRGSFFSLGDAKVLCTYHPSYLLRYEPAKKQVWADMQMLMAELGLEAG